MNFCRIPSAIRTSLVPQRIRARTFLLLLALHPSPSGEHGIALGIVAGVLVREVESGVGILEICFSYEGVGSEAKYRSSVSECGVPLCELDLRCVHNIHDLGLCIATNLRRMRQFMDHSQDLGRSIF